MAWQDDLDRMARDFATAFDQSKAMRTLAVCFVVCLCVAALASAFADVTRPRIYIVKESAKESD